MDVLTIVILAKYAQGILPFQQYCELVFSLKPAKRSLFFKDLATITSNLGISRNDVENYLRETELSDAPDVASVIRDTPVEALINTLVARIETNPEGYFHAMLGLFTMAYSRGYSKFKDDPQKFWYWNFKVYSNADRLTWRAWETVDLSNFKE